MRKSILALGLLAVLATPALATQPNHPSGVVGGFAAGQFVTVGAAVSIAQGGTVAAPSASESFGRGTAGFGVQGGTFGGFQTNESGAITQGRAVGLGLSIGGAAGVAGFGGFSRF